MVTQEYYRAQPMAVGSTYIVNGSHMAGFIASTVGTVTITDFNGTVLGNALPLALGFNRIPILFNSPAGNIVALTGAAGTLLL